MRWAASTAFSLVPDWPILYGDAFRLSTNPVRAKSCPRIPILWESQIMKQLAICSTLSAALVASSWARAATYYYGPTGSSSAACTQPAPCALDYNLSGKSFQPGDTIYLLGGTYSGQYIRNGASGNSGAWITFKAVDGQLPILDGGGGVGCGVEPSAAVQYVRFDGIASRNWQSSGFSNGWNNPSSHVEFINGIADGNGINGIAFYKATGVLIQQNLVAHNGNQQPSWSSGVNLYTAGGTYQDNIVQSNVSFENIDISSHHSDGSGFILDQGSSGASFENNIGFRNGGSCIRLTTSGGSHVVNNTCYHDGLEPSDAQGAPSSPGEIYYSDATSTSGTVFQNNLAAASGYNNTQSAFGGQVPTQTTNYAVNANAATPFFVDPAGTNPDFHLTSSATANIVDKGTASGAPTTDIGFDPTCIKKGSPGGASWWTYTIDYTTIASLGGVARCFNPATRSSTPDIGAYEYNGTAGTGGAPGTGGTTSTGGSGATGGTTSSGGSRVTGGTVAMGGTTSSGGSRATGGTVAMGGTTSSGGSKATGGTAATGGTIGTGGSKATGGSVASTGATQVLGGISGTGGTTSFVVGGQANTGGTQSTGGTMNGAASSGGTLVATGGLSNAGGAMGTGGMSGTGGANGGAGGVSTSAGGVPSPGDAGYAMDGGGETGVAGNSGSGHSSNAGGCGCRVAGGSPHSTLAGVFSLLALAILRRRRARWEID
jgi:MYXO-CTERM domain-containing protein